MRKTKENIDILNSLESSPLEFLQKSLKKIVTEKLAVSEASYLKTECLGMGSRLNDIILSLNQKSQSIEAEA